MDVQEGGIGLALLEAGGAGDPGLDLRPVLRDGREALRLAQLTPCAELLAELRQLRPADVELAEVGRRRAGARDGPVADVVPGEDDVAARNELGVAALRRDAVDVDVAAVLDREDDRAAVPDRLPDLRVGVAGAVE